MIKRLVLPLFAFFVLTACGGKQPEDTTKSTGAPQSFGEKITADGAVSMPEMLSNMQGADSMAVKLKGKVESVCQAKGCWMNLQESNGGEVFVKFKDYAFFMPKDIAGREVIVDGYVVRSITPVDELRHYAEDEGKSKEEIEAITEPKEELKFMASGVLLLPENKQ